MKTGLIFIFFVGAVSVSVHLEKPTTNTRSSSNATAPSDGSAQDRPDSASSVIDKNLRKKLTSKQSVVNVFITMHDTTKSVLDSIKRQNFSSRKTKRRTLVNKLKERSTRSQTKVVKKLQFFGMIAGKHFQQFWITNQVMIMKANMTVLEMLDEMDESNIASIEEEIEIPLDDSVNEVFDDPMIQGGVTLAQWGVEKMRCPEVWEWGIDGEDIVVGTIDTGVRGTHEALEDSFVGDYGWYDPSGKTIERNDAKGHGTHTMGTILGSMNGIGVAPGATWMACKGCASTSCSQGDLVACGEFMACPTLADGTEADSDMAPHIVSNSWAGGTTGIWFDEVEVLATWKEAGIIALAAIGNSGPSCGKAQYIGNSPDVIGVGSTDSNDKMSYFSSPGPTADGRMKPGISAPGSSVFSAYHTSDTAYATMSGTNMACPHAAGLVALLLSDKDLDYDEVLTCLKGGSAPIVSSNVTCGGISDTKFSNNNGGEGRIDAVNAFDVLDNL